VPLDQRHGCLEVDQDALDKGHGSAGVHILDEIAVGRNRSIAGGVDLASLRTHNAVAWLDWIISDSFLELLCLGTPQKPAPCCSRVEVVTLDQVGQPCGILELHTVGRSERCNVFRCGVLSFHKVGDVAEKLLQPSGTDDFDHSCRCCAGENRIFGDQDADVLEPAVVRARARGINAHGPIPADALIPAAVRGKWKMIIACYHDQGHVPFKAVYGDGGVNITVGLPVVRVSVDHGTAFDIAGHGVAREASLVLSCQRAADLAPGWKDVWQAARQSRAASA
jgi:Pyridoxal phosphate biosynthetic protein PdxA